MILGTMTMAATMFAQAPLSFEVATIKPAPAIIAGQNQKVTAGVHVDRNQFQSNSLTLRDYMGIAYQLRIYQVEGPEWISTDRFDINAKIPSLDGRTMQNEDLQSMMKALIEERFEVKAHKVKRDFPIYALVQLKDGIKAKPSAQDAIDANGVTVGGTGGAQGSVISLGRGSTMTMGGNRLAVTKASTLTLAELLARFTDRPVLDQTGLTDTYDFEMTMTQEDFQAMQIRSAIAAGVTLPPQALKLLEVASGDSMHEALAKLGLKLEAKKAPMDVMIVDSANKTPSEN
jgi:uncharacterized protein (TIGR03435 family)